jgi:hypothetical protein
MFVTSKTWLLCFSLMISAALVLPVLGQNLVTNPGFETGDFTGWSLTGDSTEVLNVGSGGNPHTGPYSATFFQTGSLDSLTQNLLTTTGQSYDLTFWLSNAPFGTSTQIFQVWWDGQIILDEHDTTQFSYTQLTFSDLVATGGVTTLMFKGRNDPGSYSLDDVSVTDGVAPVPEASTWSIGAAVTALLGLHFFRSRRSGRAC